MFTTNNTNPAQVYPSKCSRDLYSSCRISSHCTISELCTQVFHAKKIYYPSAIAVQYARLNSCCSTKLSVISDFPVRCGSAKTEQSAVVGGQWGLSASQRHEIRLVPIQAPSTPSYAQCLVTLVALQDLCPETTWYLSCDHAYRYSNLLQ